MAGVQHPAYKLGQMVPGCTFCQAVWERYIRNPWGWFT